jgi:hypothetical protein
VFKRLERGVQEHRFKQVFPSLSFWAFKMNLLSIFSRLYVSRRKIVTAGASAFIIGLVLGALLLNLPSFNASKLSPFASVSLSPAYTIMGASAFRMSLPEMTLQINATEYSLPVNLSEVEGYQELKTWLQITPEQEQLLSQNGFVVLRVNNFGTLQDFYDSAYENGKPILITTDAVLHAYHALFDETLKQAESDELASELNNTINALLNQSQEQSQSMAGTLLEGASKLNLMYLEVAHALMQPSFTPTTREAQQELQLISDHSQMTSSPIFGYVEDYTQYVPRGHYTESDQLKAYFRTMMWLSRMRFSLLKDQGAVDVEQTRAALLLAGMVAENQSIYNAWQRIYAVTEFFVGVSDDLTFQDYLSVLSQEGITTAAQILDESTVVSVAKELLNRNTAKILGTYTEYNPTLTQEEQLQEALNQTAGLRFMGQRFIPDSYMFQQLVYPEVGNSGVPRLFPKGLDVPAVLGSDLARKILNKTELVYQNYTQQIEKLRAEFGALNAANWTQDLYWSWLYTANTTLAEIPSSVKYPTFMTTPAWGYEKLQTFEGTWTELRHDTILYSEQSYGYPLIPPPSNTAYVEPYPETYRTMIGLINMTINGLTQLGLLNASKSEPPLEWGLTTLMTASQLFLNASEVELEGKALDSNLQIQIRRTSQTISHIVMSLSDQDQEASLVADVHTDPNTGQVLEEGLGDFSVLVVVHADPNDALCAAAGPVFNYYEFTVPISNRLTDEAWRAMLSSGPKPETPEWTDTFAK